MMGDGSLCPDHLDLLAAPCHEAAVVSLLRGWLCRPGERLLDLKGIRAGSWVNRRPAWPCSPPDHGRGPLHTAAQQAGGVPGPPARAVPQEASHRRMESVLSSWEPALVVVHPSLTSQQLGTDAVLF